MKILVVEDDEKLNQIICAYLERSGYQARGCQNPVEGYDLLYAEPFDLIVSDIMMPQVETGVSKIQLQNQIFRRPLSLPRSVRV